MHLQVRARWKCVVRFSLQLLHPLQKILWHPLNKIFQGDFTVLLDIIAKEHPATNWMQLNPQLITLMDVLSWILFINFTVPFRSEQ